VRVCFMRTTSSLVRERERERRREGEREREREKEGGREREGERYVEYVQNHYFYF
jgi:hypothetical protein